MSTPAKKKRKKSGSTKGKSKRYRWLLLIIILILVAGAFGTYKVFGPNTGNFSDGEYLYIHTGSTYEQVLKTLDEGGFVKDMVSFDLLAKKANYPSHIGAGRYHIHKGMSNYHIIRMLRAHRQAPVRLVINKLRTKDDFIRFVSQRLEADSNTFRFMFSDNVYLRQFGLDSNTVMCGVMPDTYDFYWNVTAEQVFKKLWNNYDRFWTEERKNKAKNKGLTPEEVVIVASIVEEETNNSGEKKDVASVYLNRLKKGMKLQADPTARFAWGDFTIRRITATQTNFASPYNTYYSLGLPPGPICTPAKPTINAVLNANTTDYLYFCAKGDGSGTHLFSSSYNEHIQNARSYHKQLNDRGIH